VLTRIARASERIGFLPTVICVLSWLVIGAFGVRLMASAPWRPSLVVACMIALGALIGAGGLVGFWLIADHVDYIRIGYRVRWLRDDDYLYEERMQGGAVRSLPIVRRIVGEGYPAPSEVHLLSEASWPSDAPQWARGRRAEIADRIARCFGSEQGGEVRFAEL
jgi:hypothetical protein